MMAVGVDGGRVAMGAMPLESQAYSGRSKGDIGQNEVNANENADTKELGQGKLR